MRLTPKVIRAHSEEAGEQVVVDRRWGSAPIDVSRVEDLFAEGGRAGGLDVAKDRSHGEALSIGEEACGGRVRGAFAGSASGAASSKNRK